MEPELFGELNSVMTIGREMSSNCTTQNCMGAIFIQERQVKQTPAYVHIFSSPVIWDVTQISRGGFYCQSGTWMPQCSKVSLSSAKLSLRSVCVPSCQLCSVPACLSLHIPFSCSHQSLQIFFFSVVVFLFLIHYPPQFLPSISAFHVHVPFLLSGVMLVQPWARTSASSSPCLIVRYRICCIKYFTISIVIGILSYYMLGTPCSLSKNTLGTHTLWWHFRPLLHHQSYYFPVGCNISVTDMWSHISVNNYRLQLWAGALGRRQTWGGGDTDSHDTANLLSPKPLVWLLRGESGLNIKWAK